MQRKNINAPEEGAAAGRGAAAHLGSCGEPEPPLRWTSTPSTLGGRVLGSRGTTMGQ